MHVAILEDADVPTLAVQGLNEATRKARQAGEIIVVRGGQLLKINGDATVQIVRAVPGRKKVAMRTKRLKR